MFEWRKEKQNVWMVKKKSKMAWKIMNEDLKIMFKQVLNVDEAEHEMNWGRKKKQKKFKSRKNKVEKKQYPNIVSSTISNRNGCYQIFLLLLTVLSELFSTS